MYRFITPLSVCLLASLAGWSCQDATDPAAEAGERTHPQLAVGDDGPINLLTCRKHLPPQLARDDLVETNLDTSPAYARIESVWPTGIPADENYGAIYFYFNDPAGTTPTDFNLLDFFDLRLFDPKFRAAQGLELAVDAVAWFVPGVFAPWFSIDTGGPVEMWFITRQQVDAVVADGVLTIGELEALTPPPLKGHTKKFCEELRPFPGVTNFLNTFAKGELEDGRKFKFELHSQNFTSSTPDPVIFEVDIKLFH